MNGLPTVRVDDILVHPRDNDLIIATHGRSIWIIDDISPLQQLRDQMTNADARVFDVRPAIVYANDIQKAIWSEGANVFKARRRPAARHRNQLLAEDSAAGGCEDHHQRHHGPGDPRDGGHRRTAGMNRVQWNLAPTHHPVAEASRRCRRRRRWGWRRIRGRGASRDLPGQGHARRQGLGQKDGWSKPTRPSCNR